MVDLLKIGFRTFRWQISTFSGSKILSDSLSCDAVIFTGPRGFLPVMSGSPTNFRDDCNSSSALTIPMQI